jgi:hypothetical protein
MKKDFEKFCHSKFEPKHCIVPRRGALDLFELSYDIQFIHSVGTS